MAMYRSLLLGCGGRATEHVDVYRDLPNMEMVACCDRIPERVQQFQDKYGIPQGFTDLEEALDKVRPDIVHCSTMPTRRVWEAETCARYGVKAAVIEKPVAVKPSDLRGLEEVYQRTGMEIIVNCQRRYFPQFCDGVINDIVHNKLGDLYFVRASTKANSMAMGPHTMDLLLMFLNEARPEQVWAVGYGLWEPTDDPHDYRNSHLSPEHLLAEYWFPGGVRVIFDCTDDALGTPGEENFWMHLHFDFLGSRGRLYLTQNMGYWYQTEGMAEPVHGESSWTNQGRQGQRDFTAAVAEHLDGTRPHLNRWETQRNVVEALLGAQQSLYEGKKTSFPLTLSDEQWEELRGRLRAT